MKIIGVTTTGSYESWTKWSIASIYNSVDEIIVINGGIDINDPDGPDNIPLQRELKQLKEIDIKNKIQQIKPDWKNVKFAKKESCEAGRGRNISLAFQYAYKAGADWIYKLDSDQIAENITKGELDDLAEAGDRLGISGYRFAEYADFFREYDKAQALPDNFTDDGSLFFKANKQAWATGQGSPVHYCDQREVHDLRTFHMRRIHPPDLNEHTYHYRRFFYHTFGPNSIMELPDNKKLGRKLIHEEITKMAKAQTKSLMNSKGHDRFYFNSEKFPPGKPLVVKMGCKNYIKKGFPK